MLTDKTKDTYADRLSKEVSAVEIVYCTKL